MNSLTRAVIDAGLGTGDAVGFADRGGPVNGPFGTRGAALVNDLEQRCLMDEARMSTYVLEEAKTISPLKLITMTLALDLDSASR